ncbi:uncharacterized protein LOC100211417 isoform X2 [Hydra vulgaris]|uniref:Uncharacterized protein LOC100211417 isoform X2 n=1 Tax=Hydra vulgaris TaxID=6087 RepID=A0ABM4B641_HYDVU
MQKIKRIQLTAHILLQKRYCTCSNLDDILEPHFLNGLNNYSSPENIRKIASIAEQNLNPNLIKEWIDKRKRKDKQRKSVSKSLSGNNIPFETPPLRMPPPSKVTTLKLDCWKYYLQDFRLEDKDWLLNGIADGFSLYCNPLAALSSAKRNLASAYEEPAIIDQYLIDEIKFGTMAGPFYQPPFEDCHINRFGVIPKSSGKWRLITDLSYPPGRSVNDGISVADSTVSYTGLTAAIKKILLLGEGCLLAKFDIQRAYRLIAIKEDERKLLVLNWKGCYYVDLALPFGARSAPQTFTRFSNVLEWILTYHGEIKYIQHSLDDFLICGPPNSKVCGESLDKAFEICKELGILIEHTKTEGPSTCITFLGFIIDTTKLELRIPELKLVKIRALLDEWCIKRHGTKRDLLSLIGVLFYCCQAIIPGRPFLKQLLLKAYSVDHLWSQVRLNENELQDLKWWFFLLNNWNGRSLLRNLPKDALQLHS